MKFILLAIIAYIVIIVLVSRIKRKNSSGETFEKFIAGNSFGSISKGAVVTAVLEASQIHIYDKNNHVSLNYEKITNVEVTSDKEIEEKSKSVAGRALLGGVVLGPFGAIIGGMSGIGSKQKKIVHNYILISYDSEGTEEKSGILLEVGVNAWDRFMDELKEKSNLSKGKSVEL